MHELDIPEFLRISQADRKEAWLRFWLNRKVEKTYTVDSSLDYAILDRFEAIEEEAEEAAKQDNQGVAQSGRASHLECDGPKFKYSHPDQIKRGRPAKPKVEKPKSTHGNVGKAWMLNRVTGERLRTNEVDKYEALGYVKAGPRTK